VITIAEFRYAPAAALVLLATALPGDRAAADQVIPDDLIVQFSLCVGLDCVNGEAFNSATIRLKENNTRIDFMDTSVGTFPTRDWRLEANSNVSGGANRFAIKDMGNSATGAEGGTALLTVTAGAPANSIFVASTGRVGFKTSTPVLELHVNDSDSPGLRLEQNAGGGFTAHTWDIAGNETNFFIRDVTSGSRLPLRIRPGAPTSSLDIAASGNVGIGTGAPAQNLHIVSSGMTAVRLDSTAATGTQWQMFVDGNNGNYRIRDITSSTSPIIIRPNSPTGSIDVGETRVRIGTLLNCTNGVRTTSVGDLQCLPAPDPLPGSQAGTPAGVGAMRVAARSGQPGQNGDPGASGSKAQPGDGQVADGGCTAGDMAGRWNLIGTNVERFGANSVLWCDVELKPAQHASAIRYTIGGNCRNHSANEGTPENLTVVGVGPVTTTKACGLNGRLAIKRGNATVATATIIEGRVEGPVGQKTRAVAVSRWVRGRTSAVQTFVLQR
jgi:hypothetical protein